ncbi:MAG: methyltransferase domain-containing protein [Gammaproteobacteria bacterium]|nr:methyltransferase domain-containing protein [Gammaproteobacteria bacterium]
MPTPAAVQAHFERTAGAYDEHAALEAEVGARLLDRVEFRRIEVNRVADLGCGTGASAEQLKRRFPKARVVGLDRSGAMLRRLLRRSKLLRPLQAVCGDLGALPLAGASVDLAVSNLAIDFLDDPMPFFREVRRVLRPGGLFLFSAYGQGSLAELLEAGQAVAPGAPAPEFSDLVALGDALAAAGLKEPVMDIERIHLTYSSVAAMLDELAVTGSSVLVPGWGRYRADSEALAEAYRSSESEGRLPLGFEIVIGTAFGSPDPLPPRPGGPDTVTVSVDSLLRSRGMGYD